MNRYDEEHSDEVVVLINRLTAQAKRRERRYAITAALFAIIAAIAAAGGWLAYDHSRRTLAQDFEAREDLELAVETLDSLASRVVGDLAALQGAPQDELVRILARAEAGLAEFAGNANLDDPQHERRRADLLIDFSTAYLSLGNPERAVETATEAQAILAALPNPGSAALLRATVLMAEGDARNALDDVEGALAAYGRAVEIHQKMLAETPEDRALRHGLSVALEREGQVLTRRGDVVDGEARLREVVALREALVSGAADPPGAASELAVAYSNLGDLKGHIGAHKEAIDLYGRVIATYDRLLAEDATNTQWQDMRARHLVRLGRVNLAAGAAPAALDALHQAEKTYISLSDASPSNVTWQVRLGDVLDEIGAAETASVDLPAARAALTRALDIRRRLAEDRPEDRALQRSFAGTLVALAKVDRAENLTDTASERVGEALKLHRAVAAADPANRQAMDDLTRMLAMAADFGVDPQANLEEALNLLTTLENRGDLRDGQAEFMADIRSQLGRTTQ